MPVGRKIIPPSNLDRNLFDSGRKVEQSARANSDAIASLKTVTTADYQQMNAATGAMNNQVSALRNYLYSIPSATVRSTTVNGVTLPANTWTNVISDTVQIPALQNKVTLIVSMTAGFNHPTQNPTLWFSLNPGSAPIIEAPMANSFVAPQGGGNYNAFGANASGSTSFSFPRRVGGTAEVRLGFWSPEAITLSGSVTLSYDLIAGGPL